MKCAELRYLGYFALSGAAIIGAAFSLISAAALVLVAAL